MTEQTVQDITAERIQKAQDHIRALCAKAFQEGYATGVQRGFEMAVATMNEQQKKSIILA